MLRTFTAAAIFALSTGAVQAQPVTTAQASVAYDDLKLSRQADAHILFQRIQSAAREACWAAGNHVRELRDCMDTASAQASAIVATRMAAARHNAVAENSQ